MKNIETVKRRETVQFIKKTDEDVFYIIISSDLNFIVSVNNYFLFMKLKFELFLHIEFEVDETRYSLANLAEKKANRFIEFVKSEKVVEELEIYHNPFYRFKKLPNKETWLAEFEIWDRTKNMVIPEFKNQKIQRTLF